MARVIEAHLPRAQSSMHDGRWERSALMGSELRGKVLGIVGLGRIGSAVATRARAFGMEVVAYDPYIPDDRFVAMQVRRMPTLESLLAASQFCSLHVPLTDETKGMIGSTELAMLRRGAIIANLKRKEADAKAMSESLAAETGAAIRESVLGSVRSTNEYNATRAVKLPAFLRASA